MENLFFNLTNLINKETTIETKNYDVKILHDRILFLDKNQHIYLNMQTLEFFEIMEKIKNEINNNYNEMVDII